MAMGLGASCLVGRRGILAVVAACVVFVRGCMPAALGCLGAAGSFVVGARSGGFTSLGVSRRQAGWLYRGRSAS